MNFLKLNNGFEIPEIGFGTYKAAQDESIKVISLAIEAGYRYFDTASFYGTERFISEAIEKSKISREKFFIASKIWKTEMGYENVKTAFKKNLENLKTDYLDLYMIHWPRPDLNYPEWKKLDIDTWKSMEELYSEGKIRAIGLSNFLPHHIENIISNCNIKPMTAQIEFHAGHTQEATVSYCQKNNILVQAWSPIGRGRVLNDELILELSEKYNATPAQICLNFCVKKKIMPLPKASSIERMKENLDSLKINLSQEDVWKIETMPPVGWSGEHPDRERVFL